MVCLSNLGGISLRALQGSIKAQFSFLRDKRVQLNNLSCFEFDLELQFEMYCEISACGIFLKYVVMIHVTHFHRPILSVFVQVYIKCILDAYMFDIVLMFIFVYRF